MAREEGRGGEEGHVPLAGDAAARGGGAAAVGGADVRSVHLWCCF